MTEPSYRVAVVGALRATGRQVLTCLEQRRFPVAEVIALGSRGVAGTPVRFGEKRVRVREVTPESFTGVHIVFFCGGPESARKILPWAAAQRCLIIDLSSASRAGVPLIVPEVNASAVRTGAGRVLASPSSAAVMLSVVLAPLHAAAGLERVVVTSHQAVSGTSTKAVEELSSQVTSLFSAQEVSTRVYGKQIAFNLLPQCGHLDPDGHSEQEKHLVAETRLVLGLPALRMSATCIRVPVFHGYAQNVNIQLARPLKANDARGVLSAAPGILVEDEPAKDRYPTPASVIDTDAVYVGRVRDDASVPHGLDLWIAADNLRKGTALNAVQIAEIALRELRP